MAREKTGDKIGETADGAEAAPAARPEGGRGFGVRIIYDELKRDILEMRLAPGAGLDETRLSERFQMSRTPVREALVRLVAEGLATTLPNRNTIVSPIDLANLPVYFDALTLMYRVTTRLAALKRTAADIERLKDEQAKFAHAVRSADALAMIGTNRDFHVAIAEAGRNRYYTDLFTRLLDEGRRILRVYYSSFDDHLPDPYVAEHDEMIAAIAARDAAAAEEVAGRHARQIIGQLQHFLASGEGAMISLRG